MNNFRQDVCVKVRALNNTFDSDGNMVWVDSHEDHLDYSSKFEIAVLNRTNKEVIASYSFEDISDTLDKMVEISNDNSHYSFEKGNMPKPIYEQFLLMTAPTMTP